MCNHCIARVCSYSYLGAPFYYDDIHNFGAYFTVYDRKSKEGKAIYLESIRTKISQAQHADIQSLVHVLDWRDARDAVVHVISDPLPDFGVPPNVYEGAVDDAPMHVVDKQIVRVSISHVRLDATTCVLYTGRELYLPHGFVTKVPNSLKFAIYIFHFSDNLIADLSRLGPPPQSPDCLHPPRCLYDPRMAHELLSRHD